jgi:hypothetical protein
MHTLSIMARDALSSTFSILLVQRSTDPMKAKRAHLQHQATYYALCVQSQLLTASMHHRTLVLQFLSLFLPLLATSPNLPRSRCLKL